MNLITVKHRYDCGHDWYIQLINTGKHVPAPFKNWSLFQGSVSWNDYTSWPYLQIKCGCGGMISVVFWVYKFGIDLGILERTWNWAFLDGKDENEVDLG